PGAAPLDVGGFGTDSRDPLLHCLGHELRSVVGPDVSGKAPQDEQVGQNVDHIDRLELAGDTDRQAFMGELVEHVEHPVLASLVGAVLDKVVGPDMIALLRPQPNARSVGQPEPAALGVLMGDLQPLTLPDTLDPLVVDCPARLAQQFGDLAIAVAAVLPSKLDNIGGEKRPVPPSAQDPALCRAMLPERRTGATLGDMQLRSHLLNAGTATRGACRMSLSSVKSETALRSRLFSSSRSLRRFTCSLFSPPNSWRHRSSVTSLTRIWRIASAMACPCETRTSTCRSFATISSGLYRFLAITVLLDVKRHTSSRTTSMGADQYSISSGERDVTVTL